VALKMRDWNLRVGIFGTNVVKNAGVENAKLENGAQEMQG